MVRWLLDRIRLDRSRREWADAARFGWTAWRIGESGQKERGTTFGRVPLRGVKPEARMP
jgi:hypothetical protein